MDSVESRGRRTEWTLAGAVALLAVLPYLNSLTHGFVYDDIAIVAENPRIRSFASLGEVFTTDWWNGTRPQSRLYRPLTMSTFAVDYALARPGEGASPAAAIPDEDALPFHVQNVLWHAAACVVLCVMVLELFGSAGLALAAAALFAVHPIHTEVVDGIVGRAETMAACFAFGAMLIGWRVVRDDPPGAAPPVAAGALLFAALLSKESAIFVPVIPLFWLTARSPAERRNLLRRTSFRRLLVSLGVAAAAYLAMRAAVLGSPVAGFRTAPGTIVVDNPIAGATGAARVLTPISVFGTAVAKLVYPRVLSADYSYTQIPLVGGIDGRTVACALLLAGLAALALRLRARAPAASFGLVLFLVSWLPTSNLAIVIGTVFGERLLYLPSAGICVAVAGGALALGSRVKLEKAVLVAIALVVAAGAARTWTRNRDWKDTLTLFAATAASSPRSCKALDGYASELFTAGRPAEARAWAQRALAIYPAYAGAHLTLGKTLRVLANEEHDAGKRAELRSQAAEHARILVGLFSASAGGGNGLADAWNLEGSLALDDGDADAALDAFARSLESQPSFVPSLVGSGVALARQADRESDASRRESLRRAAADRFERALALDPASATARDNLAILRPADPAAAANLHGLRGTALLKEGKFPEALAEFREAARLQPRAARGYLGVGTALASQADAEPDTARKRALADGAVEAFEQALAVEPDNPDAHMNIAVTYLRQAREPAKVAEHFRAYLRLVPSAPQRAQMEETIRRMESSGR